MQETEGDVQGTAPRLLADSCCSSACNRGAASPSCLRRSLRMLRPRWSSWVSGEQQGGRGVRAVGRGSERWVRGWAVRGDLAAASCCLLAHLLPFCDCPCPQPSPPPAAAQCCSVHSVPTTLVLAPCSSTALCPTSSCPYVLSALVPPWPDVPVLPYLPVPMSPQPSALHVHMSLCLCPHVFVSLSCSLVPTMSSCLSLTLSPHPDVPMSPCSCVPMSPCMTPP